MGWIQFGDDIKETIMEGFLIKSPPLRNNRRKLSNIFRDLSCVHPTGDHEQQRWRKRYCVLYKIRNATSTEVKFDYFKDQGCKTFKGRVDLQSCRSVYPDANVERVPHTFCVVTKCDGKDRSYYFAASTSSEKDEWVQHLVAVMKIAVENHTQQFVCSPSQSARNFSTSHNYPLADTCITRDVLRMATSMGFPPASMDYTEWPIGDDSLSDYGNLKDEDDEYAKVPSSEHAYVNLPGASLEENATANLPTVTHVEQTLHEGLELPPKRPPSRYPNANLEKTPKMNERPPDDIYFIGWGDAPPSDAPKEPNKVTRRPPPPLPVGASPRVHRHSQALIDFGQHQRHTLIPDKAAITSRTQTLNNPFSSGHHLPDVPHLPSAMVAPSVSIESALLSTIDTDSYSNLAESALPTRDLRLTPGDDASSSSDDDDDDDSTDAVGDAATIEINSGETLGKLGSRPVTESSKATSEALPDSITCEGTVMGGPTCATSRCAPPCLASNNSECGATLTSETTSPPCGLHYIDARNLDLKVSPKVVPPPRNRKSAHPAETIQQPVVHTPSIPTEPQRATSPPVEYKEIDLLSTNALAVVASRFLDNTSVS